MTFTKPRSIESHDHSVKIFDLRIPEIWKSYRNIKNKKNGCVGQKVLYLNTITTKILGICFRYHLTEFDIGIKQIKAFQNISKNQSGCQKLMTNAVFNIDILALETKVPARSFEMGNAHCTVYLVCNYYMFIGSS